MEYMYGKMVFSIKYYWSIGDRYEGEWKECLKHGNGTDIYHNGDSYVGQYKFGKPCGYGQYFWKNGSSYSGEFLDSLKHGFGKWRKSKDHNTNLYEGQYFKDKKQGFGIFKWASGNVYIGQYKNDERDGVGEMKWTDGSLYIGQWEKGIQNGYGRMYFPDGSVKEGIFENNVFKGINGVDLTKVPQELFDRNFDILSYAPKDLLFSEEILEAARKPKNISKTAENNAMRPTDTSYTSYSGATNFTAHKQNGRTLSKNLPNIYQGYKANIPQTGYKKKKNKSFAINSRVMTQENDRTSTSQMPAVLENPRKKKLKIKRSKKRKIWIPVGKAKYFDVIHMPYAVY